MTRVMIATLAALVAGVGCGGKKPPAAPAASHRGVATAPTSHRATRPSSKSSKPATKSSKRTGAKPDTAGHNPLTNH